MERGLQPVLYIIKKTGHDMKWGQPPLLVGLQRLTGKVKHLRVPSTQYKAWGALFFVGQRIVECQPKHFGHPASDGRLVAQDGLAHVQR